MLSPIPTILLAPFASDDFTPSKAFQAHDEAFTGLESSHSPLLLSELTATAADTVFNPTPSKLSTLSSSPPPALAVFNVTVPPGKTHRRSTETHTDPLRPTSLFHFRRSDQSADQTHASVQSTISMLTQRRFTADLPIRPLPQSTSLPPIRPTPTLSSSPKPSSMIDDFYFVYNW
ncbi:hypothetical protein CMV_025117 [Castanea mollissima]|uniref:Uncharacterized protein n=1 Tax=Castanea mollissima TaxID=60419 RepID=A0A8J4V5B4_9ROSI|nr:hypothetical protein CMV_025117 [Castanea mollissima]